MTLNQEFINMIDSLADPRLKGLTQALSSSPSPVSLRLNSRCFPSSVSPSLPSRPVPWNHRGFILDDGAGRPQFTWDPMMHAGAYYVQEAASMIHGHILATLLARRPDPLAPVALLDACAAPGGKTTAAVDVLPQGSAVVANEWDFRRAEILRENLAKWGRGISTIVTRGDTRRLRRLSSVFDVVIADVPCSGEGMFRKDPAAVTQWSPRLVVECRGRQEEIIENLWQTLKPGGWLIYSTCTFNRTEDEDMIEWIISYFDAEPVEIPVDPSWGIVGAIADPAAPGGGSLPVMRFLPGVTPTEGLFVAVLRKPGDSEGSQRRERPSKPTKSKPQHAPREVEEWLAKRPDGSSLSLLVTETEGKPSDVWAIEEHWVPLRDALLREADVIAPGLHVATIKGKSVMPAAPLAFSQWLAPGAFPRVDLDYDAAVAFLQRGVPALSPDVPLGFVLLTYRGMPLGFVKNLGNRANSLYPAEWRILSTHAPASQVSLFDVDSAH
ncbi:MAG: hypothetical protein K2M04_04285 [Muribaculaceae bacterium]|nr:hypothetical protein [Muribaculaceae bacterium]